MKRTPWFRDWFAGEYYMALYPHRDGAEARRAVQLLRDTTGGKPGTRVLDLACGAGRHLLELRRIGYRATGLDLSFRMLKTARGTVPAAALVQSDMRFLPFRSGSFEMVTSYFTSFGYFDDEGDDLRVLHEVRRVLSPGGALLLDFMNAEEVVANLKRKDRRTVSGMDVVQERRLIEDGRVVEKRIIIGPRDGAPEQRFVERVRMYRPGELASMMTEARLDPGPVFGGYDRSPFSSATSPRYIVVANASR